MSEVNLIAPDVTVLTMPAESFQKAAQSVVGAPKETLTKRSFFKSDKSKYAGKVELDGETFYFDRISDGVLEKIEAVPQRIKAALGKDEEPTAKQQKAKDVIELDAVDMVIVDALRAWSLDAPCDDANKRDLHLDIKARLCDRISAFTRAGETEARFHQRNGSGGIAGQGVA